MKDIKVTITINRSAHEAFDFTLNPDNTPKWVGNVVKEQSNETPTRLGTIYRNQGHDGSWREFEITEFEPDKMFTMTEKGSHIHVQYTFKPLGDDQCELEYYVWVDSGDIGWPFTQDNLENIVQKLKEVIEA